MTEFIELIIVGCIVVFVLFIIDLEILIPFIKKKIFGDKND